MEHITNHTELYSPIDTPVTNPLSASEMADFELYQQIDGLVDLAFAPLPMPGYAAQEFVGFHIYDVEGSEESVPTWISKQVAHILSGKRLGKRVRTAQPPNALYDMEMHFLKHEARPYVERHANFEYAMASYEDLSEAQALLEDGTVIKLGDRLWEGEVLTGWVKGGDGVTLLLTPKGTSYTLADLGIRNMLSKDTDIGKFMKYLKRLMAMYRHSAFGGDQVFSVDAKGRPMLQYRLNGKSFKLFYDTPLPKIYDLLSKRQRQVAIEGQGVASLRWANAHLGEHPDRGGPWVAGDTARITFTCNKFMWKGHLMVLGGRRSMDMGLWDCKKIIGTDNIFVGLMGSLHAGPLRIGIQPTVNFGLQKFVAPWGERSMREYADELYQPGHSLKQFIAMYQDKLDEIYAGEDNDGVTAAKVDRWRKMSAVKNGIGTFSSEPVQQRDDFRNYTKRICDATNGKVPVPPEDGFACYYMLDPGLFDRELCFDIKGARIRGEYVYSPRMRDGQEAVTWRDPQTRHEYVIIKNSNPFKEGFALYDPNVMIISIDIAMMFVEIQGGGDYDDRGCVHTNPEVIDHFKHHLPYYPERLEPGKAAAVQSWLANNVFADRFGVRRKLTFDLQALTDKIREAKDANAGVGMIVNWLMISVDFSYYKFHYILEIAQSLECLRLSAGGVPNKAQLSEMDRLANCLTWLHHYEQYHENFVSSALESAIDGLVMNGAKGDTDYADLGMIIRAFWADCPLVPYWATIGGFEDKGRIPDACLANKPVIVNGPVSDMIKQLQSYQEQLEDVINAKQWLGLQMAPRVIREYPVTAQVKEAVNKGIHAWNLENRELRDRKLDKKASYSAFLKICLAHKFGLDKYGEEFALQYIAELERRVHNGPYGAPKLYECTKTGRMRPAPVKDAYLNNPHFFAIRVRLHERLGLAKKLHLVTLETAYQSMRNERVVVTDGHVSISANHGANLFENAGTVSGVPDGAYDMEQGFIRF